MFFFAFYNPAPEYMEIQILVIVCLSDISDLNNACVNVRNPCYTV